MSDFLVITEAAIERARRDPEFKQQLLTTTLDRLLGELHRQQRANPQGDPQALARIREAAALAARLADIIKELDEKNEIARKFAAKVTGPGR